MNQGPILSPINALLAKASMYAPLKTSLILTRGVGNPTYTRGSIATVQGFEKITAVASGESRFQGARRVQNQIAGHSNDLTNAAWTAAGAGTGSSPTVTANYAADPDGAVVASRVQFNRGAGVTINDYSRCYNLVGQAGSAPVGAVETLWIKMNTGTSCQLAIARPTYGVGQVANVTTEWQRFATPGTAGSYFEIALVGSLGSTSTADVLICRAQWEDIRGQSNTNPSEYVSVGVLAAPYHGSGIDGVKNFDTLNGNTVAANVVTEIKGAPISGVIRYLREPAATNLIKQSGDQTNAVYSILGATLTRALNVTGITNVANTATTLTDSVALSSHGMFYDDAAAGITVAAGATVAISYWLKPGTRQYVVLAIINGVNESGITVDTTTMTITGNYIVAAGTSSAASYVDPVIYANGFRRVVLVGAITALTTYYPTIAGSLISNAISYATAYLGTGATIISGGWQGETGTKGTSYIPTTNATVTRALDFLLYPQAGNISATVGSAFSDFQSNGPVNENRVLIGANGVGIGGIQLYSSTATNASITDGTGVVSKTGLGDSTTALRKHTTTWSGAVMTASGDGAALATGAFDGDMSMGATNIGIGNDLGGASSANGIGGNVLIFPMVLSVADRALLETSTF